MTHQLPPEVRVLTEDDIYRTSSQFRVWSFSPESLAERRRKTHEIAIERIERQRNKSGANGASSNGENGTSHQEKLDYLTEEEELRLVQRYCDMIRATNDHLSWPANVKATAIQYFRRFYLSNSPLTYPPKEIYKTALYLANKAESNGWAVSAFAQRISAKPEEILACEYKVIQALRFTLDVRQPNRGLKGAMMELDNIVEGRPDSKLRAEIEALQPPGQDAGSSWSPGSSGVRERVQLAYSAARALLDSPALLTDAYFLFTPSQIVFASLQLADPPLADWYLSTKIPPSSPARPKILATLRACAEVLAGFSQSDILSKEDRARLEDKLEKCRDPSTVDMVKAHLAKQRGEGEDDEEKAERKRAQREASARANADPFGPSIG